MKRGTWLVLRTVVVTESSGKGDQTQNVHESLVGGAEDLAQSLQGELSETFLDIDWGSGARC